MTIKPDAFHYDTLGLDASSLERSIANRLIYTVGKDPYTAKPRDWYHSLANTVRDRMIDRWMQTMRHYYDVDAKRVYYLSLEFLIGRTLLNSLLNMEVVEPVRTALEALGLDLEELREQEPDAGLGNGGLGRLAACFLDSMATLSLPGYGYGVRYEYGMFNQRIDVEGRQIETPENWLRYGNPWEFPRPEVIYPVKFGGRVVDYHDDHGRLCHEWVETDNVMAMAFDTPVPGYRNNTVNNMRLWSARSTREFELRYFNEGNYIKAVEAKTESENLSRVLYPDDTTEMGRVLRFKQEYWFVSASVQDILNRFLQHHDDLDQLPEKVAIHLNDTHPAIAIPELMRLLIDHHHLEWERAWRLTQAVFAYSNHTLLPEALETWPLTILERLLPRHMQIIYEINFRFLEAVRHHYPGDVARLQRMSLIDETSPRSLRMAHLAMVGSHTVNGVSKLHTELMRETIFRDFDAFYPGKIINITNGITPRRWINLANPRLADLISERLGEGWIKDLGQLQGLEAAAEDPAFRKAFRAVKRRNKADLAAKIRHHLGLRVDPDSIFDVHVKRIHQYKRQLLCLLHVVCLYNRLRAEEQPAIAPRTVIFSGKSAPGYCLAKLVIQLIHEVADVVNNDPAIGDRLKVVFIPNYDVTTAADIIPAADLSEQISTAGYEASGTGNMKLGLNGALTIGTLDGANIEICEAVGEDNIFIFGLNRQEVKRLRDESYHPIHFYNASSELRGVLDMIANGYFSPQQPERYRDIVDELLQRDAYMVMADFADYCIRQRDAETLYLNEEEWTRRCILNVARLGEFSSDRAVADYAERVWKTHPAPVENNKEIT